MKVAVYLGSARGNDEKYSELTRKVAAWLGKHHHQLVYGAGSAGQMGLLAETAHNCGCTIYGVMPEFLLEREHLYEHLEEVSIVKTMSERKQKMIDLADGFIALPGGPGTLEEIVEIISLVRLDQLKGPCVLWNLDGFYEPLREMLQTMIRAGFLDEGSVQNVRFVASMDELDNIFSETV